MTRFVCSVIAIRHKKLALRCRRHTCKESKAATSLRQTTQAAGPGPGPGRCGDVADCPAAQPPRNRAGGTGTSGCQGSCGPASEGHGDGPGTASNDRPCWTSVHAAFDYFIVEPCVMMIRLKNITCQASSKLEWRFSGQVPPWHRDPETLL
jgi:hypothetical protein